MENGLVTIATYSLPHEAEIGRTKLESEGILAFISDANTIAINWMLSNAIGGFKLQVRSADVEEAKSILGSFAENSAEDSAWGVCQRCGSRRLDVRVERRGGVFTWLLLGIPLLFPHKRLHCAACGLEQKRE